MNDVFNSAEKYYEILDRFINEHKPDILLLNPDSYTKFAAEGKLYGLDPLINADTYDIKSVAPPIIEALRSKGGGLYGFSPQFSSEVLFYNKKLFDQYGIPYPTDRMSWQDVLILAKKFPPDGNVYGIEYMNSTSPFYLFTQLLKTHDIAPFDPGVERVTVNTPSWSKNLNLVFDAYKSGVIHPIKKKSSGLLNQTDYLKSFPFIAGKTAMYYTGSSFLKELNMASQVLKEEAPDWDLVTAPVNPQQSDRSNHYIMNDIYAISAESTNIRPAWELLKFIQSDEMAKISTVTEPFSLVSRVNQIKNVEGRNMKALWSLGYLDSDSKIPLNLQNKFWLMARPKIEAVLDGKGTVEESLIDMQQQGELLLMEEK